MRRGIALIAGCRIAGCQFLRSRLKPIAVSPGRTAFRRRIDGQQIERVDRLGKRVVLRFVSGDAMIFEPRMTGLVLLAQPPSEEHLRVRFRLIGGGEQELLFWDRRGLGSVALLAAAQLDRLQVGGTLGPDALSITAEQLRCRLKSSRREIKVALLDQRAVAGIGNLYAAEILHAARIHPRTRCCRLRKGDWPRLHATMIEVLQEAIRYEGSTLNDGTYRNALNHPGRYQDCHRVYARAGQLCPTCRQAPVERIVQAQRSTFFCPRCQRKLR